MEVVEVDREDYCNDPDCGDPGWDGMVCVPITIVVRRGEGSMKAKRTRRRGRFVRWLRRILYMFICEEAASYGEAALWMPAAICWCCRRSIMSNSRFCAHCGVSQSAKQTGPITPVPPELSVTDRIATMQKIGVRPIKAYNKFYGGGGMQEKKEEQSENN